MAFLSESLLLLLLALVVAAVHGKMGYFWHITDLHWDTHYNTESHSCWRGLNTEKGEFGDHNCDSPWSLVQSAVRMMRAKNGDNVEFVFWTGDALSRGTGRVLPTHSIAALQNLTTLLRNTFNSQFVFPVLGHDDPSSPYRHLSSLWRQWLPNEALYTFSKGGYYTIEQKMKKLRLILLNTNLWVGGYNEEDPGNQWSWLEEVLEKSHRNKETVYLVGHIAPGADERQTIPPRSSLLPKHNERYLQLVRQYADIITGQFFGHLHSDTFRVVYNSEGRPVSWMFLAPSVTPRRSQSGANNPALRLYKFDTDTGQVQDYIQYYLDLGTANREHKAEWQIEYNLTSLYGLRQISAHELHELAESFTIPDGFILFARLVLFSKLSTEYWFELANSKP
ncbi:cyclic GMP-AMP phosphodiesterase SMPDL3A-like isoform X2 [Lycorma delicatula]|uniref:cyclic GMP-AMP phosphodiesterase SMPDL3A-like isoform X2 n=1 Tax=Lycorma delicatula TaxID=130591 RepID=UPI003F5166AB